MLKEKSLTNFTFYPLFWLSGCFAAGILTANSLRFDWKISLAACLLAAGLTAGFINRKDNLIFLSAAFIAVGAMCFQIENQLSAVGRLKNIYDENRLDSHEPLELVGVLRGGPEESVGGFFLEIETERLFYKSAEQKVSGKIRLFAPVPNEQIFGEYKELNLQSGSRLRVACRPVRADNFLNAGVVSRKEILDGQGIDATATVKSPLLIEKIGYEKTFAPLAAVYDIRQNLLREFREKFSVSTAGIMIASLLGNKYFLDKQTAELFREGGTFHILVISGLHITFIGGLVLLFLRFFTNRRLPQFLLASLFLWSYSIAVGADTPVIRAAVMFTVLLFSQVLYRPGNLLNALGLCGLILLVWRPADLFAPSFQLTFVSVLAIVAGAFPVLENLRKIGQWRPTGETPFPPNVSGRLKRFCEMLYWREKVWEIESKQQVWSAKLFKSPYLKLLEAKGLQGAARYLWEGVVVSLTVQIWLLPLMVYYFHRVSVASVILNLWVGFFIALESFAALLAVFFAQLSDILALPLVKLTEILNWFLLFLPGIFVENGWASFRPAVYAGKFQIIYFLYFAPVLLLMRRLNKWNPFDSISNTKIKISSKKAESSHRFLIFGTFILFAGLVVFHPFSAPLADGRLRIDFLDVGQGDAALLTFPDGLTMLVDGGGKPGFNNFYVNREDAEPELFEPDAPSIGETVVSQFLWERGYSRIDYLLATHADADHLQGLTAVAENFRVGGGALFGRMPVDDADFTGLLTVLQKRRIGIATVSRGDVLNIGGVEIEVLYPESDASPEAVSNNNHSVVLRIRYGAKSFLLTGDIEKETEGFLVHEIRSSDVVKVGHHGSRTSSIQEFVDRLNAEYAIISVGRNSPFGHPHREVVERWKAAGAKVLTTGENGTISISTDGRDLRLETFRNAPVFR